MATTSDGAQERYTDDDRGEHTRRAASAAVTTSGASAGTADLVRFGGRRPPWRVAVGTVLREWRTEQGLRLSDVAQRARVSVQYLSEVERGRKEPSSEVLGAVTEALGGSLTDLALGVARQLAPLDARGSVAARPPARIAPVRELRAITTPQTVSRPTVTDVGRRGVELLLAA